MRPLLFFSIYGTLLLLIINLRDSTVVRFIGNSWNFADKNIMLDKKDKDKVIENYKTHAGHTGSPEVQIAL